jgi:sugar (pentulose or hexulose) kinase
LGEAATARTPTARIWKALTIDGFITLKLTGQASRQLRRGTPSTAWPTICWANASTSTLLAEIGVDPAILPPLARCEADHRRSDGGGRRRRAGWRQARRSPPVRSTSTPVASPPASPPQGDIMSNLGTVGNFGVIHKQPRLQLLSEVGLAMINFAFTVGSARTYITVPSTTTGGQSIRYLRDNFSQYEVEVERVLGVKRLRPPQPAGREDAAQAATGCSSCPI